jgi:hypothetical protein
MMPPPSLSREALSRTTLLVQRDIYPGLDDETIADALATTTVRLRAGASALRTANGQTAIVTSAILCAELGAKLHVDFPETHLLTPQPPLSREGLRESLLDVCRDLITPAALASDGDFEIAVGTDVMGRGVSIAADDWGFQLTTDRAAGNVVGAVPLGPALGAVAASAEAFRHTMAKLGTAVGIEPSLEHPVRGPRPAEYSLIPLDWRPQDLGAVDSISAGAITTASLYLLLRVPGLGIQLRLIDDDIGAVSNLNRYLLFRRSLIGIPKPDALATFAMDLIRLKPVVRRFDPAHEQAILPLARNVIVGVDDIPSRWRAQAAGPGWMGVGATSHFEVVVSEHTSDSACAGCLHPHDDPGPAGDIPTISFVSALAGFLLAYRLLRIGTGAAKASQSLAYPFNLAGERPVWDGPIAPRSDCPVRCGASRAELSRRTPPAT